MVSATVSVPHLVGGLGRLVPTAVGSDKGPATGANSVSGRAISGSGLGTTHYPVVQPLVFQGVYPRVQLPPIDRRAIESVAPYQSVWAVKPLSVGLFPLPVDPRWRPGADMEVGQLVGAGKPVGSITERGFYGGKDAETLLIYVLTTAKLLSSATGRLDN